MLAGPESSAPDGEQSADAVFRAWTHAVQSPCAQTTSQYFALVGSFSTAKVMSPHVAVKRAELLARETELRDGILSAAKNADVKLAKLLERMRADAGLQPQTRRIGDEHVHQLFESGALDGLARN